MMLFKWKDLDSAKKFAGSDNLREVMQEAGVIDRPDVYFVEDLEELSH